MRHSAKLPVIVSLLVGALTLPTLPSHTAAQQVVRETPVPLAPESGVDRVDAALRRELGLFPDVSGFVSARLLRVGGSGHVLELTLRDGGDTVRERRDLSDAALAELRSRIADALAARGMSRAVTSDGRGGLVIAETVLGLGFYGWAVPVIFDIESDRGSTAAYLLTAGASFLVPLALTRSITVTDAHRDAVVWGGTRGIAYGALIGDALTLGDDSDLILGQDDSDERTILGLGMAASLAGSVLGYRAVDPQRHDRGDVALWSTAGDFALGYGFATALALGLYDAEVECLGDLCTDESNESTTAGHLTTVGLGLAGTLAARRWADARDYSVGDARALLSFGLLGAQATLPLAHAIFEGEADGERPLAAALVAGSAGALFLGDRELVGQDLTGGEGLLVQAGHVAGALLAAGVTFLVDDGAVDHDDDDLLYMITTAAGSAAGSLLTYRAVRSSGAERGARAGGNDSGPKVEVSATGLWAGWMMRDAARPVRIPVVTIRH